MSDADSDADSISDASSAHSDDDGDDVVDDYGDIIGDIITVNELCDRLRANDPRLLDYDDLFDPSVYLYYCSEAQCIEVFQALKENTSVKGFSFQYLFDHAPYFTERSALVAAEYVESSKTLQTMNLNVRQDDFRVVREMISLVLRALSRNTSVTNLTVSTHGVKIASMAFQELLTRTQTLQKLEIMRSEYQVNNEAQTVEYVVIDEVQIAAIASGFANNTTLRDLTFMSWRQVDLAPVLTALHSHPALEKIKFHTSLSGLEILLQSQDSKVKELFIDKVSTRTVGLYPVLQALRRNTTVTKLALRYNAIVANSMLSREDLQQLTAVLRQNTALQSLDLTRSALGSAGLAEIAPALYRNTSIKSLDLSRNGLNDIESANVLRELLRRNNTITSLLLSGNAFGPIAAAARSIADGVRSNTALQQLDLSCCALDDRGLSVLANAIATRNTSLQILDLEDNDFGERGFIALAESLPNIKGLQQIGFTTNASFQSTLPLLLEGLRKNMSLVEVNLDFVGFNKMELSQELKFLGQRNRFTPLLKASDPEDPSVTSPQLGIWSRALSKVATEPNLLFHILRNKPKLVESAGADSNKRKRNDE